MNSADIVILTGEDEGSSRDAGESYLPAAVDVPRNLTRAPAEPGLLRAAYPHSGESASDRSAVFSASLIRQVGIACPSVIPKRNDAAVDSHKRSRHSSSH